MGGPRGGRGGVAVTFFQTTIGIDPSGGRLAAVAVNGGLGRPGTGAPSLVCDLKAGTPQARLAEAEGALRDFVAKNGLAGSVAKLCIPADLVYVARTAFPPLKEKDVRPALSLELERLFPVPPSRLKFAWRTLKKKSPGKTADLLVTAASADFIEQWKAAVLGAGLRLAGAIPAGSAVSAACSTAGVGGGADGGVTAVLRGAGANAECTLIAAGEPFHLSLRPAVGKAIAAQAFSLAEEGMANAPCDEEEGVLLVAPAEWTGADGSRNAIGDVPCRVAADVEDRIASALGWTQIEEKQPPVWDLLGAFGAAVAERGIDLLDPEKERAGSRLAGILTPVLAVAAVVFALAWPATVAWTTRVELRRLDAELARLAPAAARVEKTMGSLSEIESKLATLRDAAAGRDEMLFVLLELTNRLPQGTWLTGLRVENGKLEMDGMSLSASEIFPVLTKDGRFRGVEFASPITRQGAENLERFQIRAEYARLKPPAPAPSAAAPPGAARAGGRP